MHIKMKKLLLLLLLRPSIYTFGQTVAEKPISKIDAFMSKKGTMIRFVDYKFPDLKTSYDIAEIRIRQFTNSPSSNYFLQITKQGKYSKSTASLDYEDLVECLKAFNNLKETAIVDMALHSDYLENKFIGNDGFEIGYFIEKDKGTWYVKLDKIGSDNTLFLQDGTVIENLLTEAKTRIDILKVKK